MSTEPRQASECPCCGTPIQGPPAFVHPAVPLLLNVRVSTEQEARDAAVGRLELVECPRCGLVFNRAFAGVPYGESYFVDATRSPRYLDHLDDVADRLAARMGASAPFSIVDVGAGQGNFLTHLVGRLGDRISRAHGFDPAFRSAEARLPDNIGATASMLDASAVAALDFTADVVVTRHVLEHVPDPTRFLASFREHFSAPFLLLVETPNVSHTLQRGLLHDFCYEHCAMASEVALALAMQRSGYRQIEVATAFDGEYLLGFAVAEASPSPAAGREYAAPRHPAPSLAGLAARFVPEHRERLRRARQRGPIAVWGGAGKGALFVHLVDPQRDLVDLVIDIHPDKQGTFLPGRGHRVVAPAEARRQGVRTVVIANPTYVDEITAQCEAHDLRVDIECVGDDPLRRTTRD